MHHRLHLTLLAAGILATCLTGIATASINIHNWCPAPVYIYRSSSGSCNLGENNICQGVAGSIPWTIPSGTVRRFDWIKDSGTAIKISRDPAWGSGILQFEDISDLDGRGPGLLGSPFRDDNVKITPTGPGSGSGTCVQVRCPAGSVCRDAYQQPDDLKTNFCPDDVGDMWIDLCHPDGRKKARAFWV
ncbi:hypothetical protein QBC47DRAFT_462710 [Echria macrotheca]|uniref:Thaumatin-like protein n=1 Tax=Echria macrotheca TaxID=438768 RepID=A0AAJ0B7N1_9PEZI|nr:hypothetical protein QBC47DRAFT_462710 [Echria macrotheca]